MASTRRSPHSLTAGPPHGPHGDTSAERTSGLPSKRSADTAALWPISRRKAVALEPCSSETAWRGTTGSTLRMKRSTGAYSVRPEMPTEACGRRPIRFRRGSGGTALLGHRRPPHATGIVGISIRSPKHSASLNAINPAIRMGLMGMATGRPARAFRAGGKCRRVELAGPLPADHHERTSPPSVASASAPPASRSRRRRAIGEGDCFPVSQSETVACRTPIRLANSPWDTPRLSRICLIRPGVHSPGSSAGGADLGRGAGVPRSAPRALKSSSTSGQWTLYPLGLISKFCRSSGVASSKRQLQVSGTLTTRPSVSSNVISSSETSTPEIRSDTSGEGDSPVGSASAAVLIPGLC
ncbi:hypothetical protein GGQ11_002896 [Salinibacter ruber]|nr:hypothetical protein [Salinibacter ruber]MCS3824001.1 hypothetical protein [Salinibacter ruber]